MEDIVKMYEICTIITLYLCIYSILNYFFKIN